MIVRTADLMGPGNIGIGTDLCQDQPDSELGGRGVVDAGGGGHRFPEDYAGSEALALAGLGATHAQAGQYDEAYALAREAVRSRKPVELPGEF